LTLPAVDPTGQGDPPTAQAAPQPAAERQKHRLKTGRVLLVEDEVIVAAMMRDLLVDLGCSIVGPVSSVAEAAAVVAREPLDAAILDVNLGGELVYPVAEVLLARGVS